MIEPDRDGRSPLHYAALANNLSEVDSLLSSGENIDLADRNGWTPLHFAAQEGSTLAAELLLDRGAAVDPSDTYGRTPLHDAVFNSRGRGEMIALLRDRGADPHAPNTSGITPVRLARMIDNFEVAQFFADLPA